MKAFRRTGKTGWFVWVLTLIGGGLGMVLGVFLTYAMYTATGKSLDPGIPNMVRSIMLNAVAFAVPVCTGYLSLELALKLRSKRYTTLRKRRVASGVLLALVLSAVIGGGTQAVFSIGDVPYEETVDVQTTKTGAKIVLLVDGSYSMGQGYGTDKFTPSLEAACSLIDGLGENNYLQFAAFAENVMPRNTSQLLQLTDANKQSIKDLIRQSDLAGGTEFDEPLTLALDTLTASYDESFVPVIIMLTDGEDDISGSVVDRLNDPNYNIQFFTVRISADGSSSSVVQELIDLADKDFPIDPAADGSVDTSQVLRAFQDALAATTTMTETHWRLGIIGEWMQYVGSDFEWHWWSFAAIILCYVLMFPAVSIVYYRGIGSSRLLVDLVFGLIAGSVMAYALWSDPGDLWAAGYYLFAIFGTTAYVTLTDAGGGDGGHLFGGKKETAPAEALQQEEAQKDV